MFIDSLAVRVLAQNFIVCYSTRYLQWGFKLPNYFRSLAVAKVVLAKGARHPAEEFKAF